MMNKESLKDSIKQDSNFSVEAESPLKITAHKLGSDHNVNNQEATPFSQEFNIIHGHASDHSPLPSKTVPQRSSVKPPVSIEYTEKKVGGSSVIGDSSYAS